VHRVNIKQITRDSIKLWQESAKNMAYFEKNREKQGKNTAPKYNVFLLQHIHDTLTAFFKIHSFILYISIASL